MRKVLLATVLIALISPGAFAGCLEYVEGRLLFDTSNNCSSEPGIPRVFGSQQFAWKGRTYMPVNTGNNFQMWNITDPANPIGESSSFFRVGNSGDSDYDLQNFSVCDDCRYGIANYKMATVFFDLGTSTRPAPSNFRKDASLNNIPGGFVFKRGSTQYVVMEGGGCTGSALFRYDGIGEEDLTKLQCLKRGVYFMDVLTGFDVGTHVYLGEKSQRVSTFEVTGSGSNLRLNFVATFTSAYMVKDRGMDVDLDNDLAISAGSTYTSIWDISSRGNPIRIGTIPGSFNRVSLSYPLVFLARKGFKGSEALYDISNVSAPAILDGVFWGQHQPHNWPSPAQGFQCSEIQAGRLSDDGSRLFLFRYSRMQRVKTGTCTGAATPTPTPTPTATPTPTPTPDPTPSPCPEQPWSVIFINGFDDGCAAIQCPCPTCPPQ